jgi:hypothetical protein
MKLINEKWPNVKKVVFYRKMLKRRNKDEIKRLGRYLDIVKKMDTK